jgi:hypothetical protein
MVCYALPDYRDMIPDGYCVSELACLFVVPGSGAAPAWGINEESVAELTRLYPQGNRRVIDTVQNQLAPAYPHDDSASGAKWPYSCALRVIVTADYA